MNLSAAAKCDRCHLISSLLTTRYSLLTTHFFFFPKRSNTSLMILSSGDCFFGGCGAG